MRSATNSILAGIVAGRIRSVVAEYHPEPGASRPVVATQVTRYGAPCHQCEMLKLAKEFFA